jgi:cell division protein FtsB
MRIIAVILGLLFLILQYDLWIGDGGLRTVWHLREEIAVQSIENKKITQRNESLLAEVNDLKKGNAAIEERARNELGMIKKGETYIQVVTDKKDSKK